jgi:hypothetical protein
MENFQVSLLSDEQGSVLTAKKIRLNFQTDAMNTGTGGNLVDVNVTVDAETESILRDGTSITGNLQQVAIRGAEAIELMKTMADGPAKTKLQARLAVWTAFQSAVQVALETALVANYKLENPSISTAP